MLDNYTIREVPPFSILCLTICISWSRKELYSLSSSLLSSATPALPLSDTASISLHRSANSLIPPAPACDASTTSLGSLCALYRVELNMYASGSSRVTSLNSGPGEGSFFDDIVCSTSSSESSIPSSSDGSIESSSSCIWLPDPSRSLTTSSP